MDAATRGLMTSTALGATGLSVTRIGIGGSPLGSAAQLYGHDTDADDALATVDRVLRGPFTFLDTSNNYGDSERRIGEAVARRGGLPEGFVLATKVDADPVTGAFDGARVVASFEESLGRLGLDRVPLLHLHDPEGFITVEDATAPGGAIEALIALRDAGRVDAIGVAGGNVEEMLRYVETGAFDVLLTHNRYTLVDRSATSLIDAAAARGMGVINAAPFGGGLLARGGAVTNRYAYGMGSERQVEAARAMSEACTGHGIPLAAAALQFAGSRSTIDAVLVGASRASRVDQLEELATTEIPSDLWEVLEALTPEPEHWIKA